MKSALTRWAFSIAFGLIVSRGRNFDHDRTSSGRLVRRDEYTATGTPTA